MSPRLVNSLAELDDHLRGLKKRPILCVSNRALTSEAWEAFEAFYKYWLGLLSDRKIKK